MAAPPRPVRRFADGGVDATDGARPAGGLIAVLAPSRGSGAETGEPARGRLTLAAADHSPWPLLPAPMHRTRTCQREAMSAFGL